MRVAAILNTILSSNSYNEHSQQWKNNEDNCNKADNNNFSNLLDEAIHELNNKQDEV